MSSQNPNIIKIPAFGRRFQLGGLYDYRNEFVLPDNHKLASLWDPAEFKATRTKEDFQLKVSFHSFNADFIDGTKWGHMKLDAHMQSSILGNLVKLKGASTYIADEIDTSISSTLRCRIKQKKEWFHLDDVIKQEKEWLYLGDPTGQHAHVNSSNLNNLPSVATHIVVGITYGVEAYHVYHFKTSIKDENDRDKAIISLEELLKIVKHAMLNSMSTKELEEMIKESDHSNILERIACRSFMDAKQSKLPHREYSLIECYQQWFALVQQLNSSTGSGITAFKSLMPIEVMLCPLEGLFTGSIPDVLSSESINKDVDQMLVERACFLWDELSEILGRVGTLLQKPESKDSARTLRDFADAINKYRCLLQKNWTAAVKQARTVDGNDVAFDEILCDAEKHPLFNMVFLENWLECKRNEIETLQTLTENIPPEIRFIRKSHVLERELCEDFSREFALILNIPSLQEKTNNILQRMKGKINLNCDEGSANNYEDNIPWFMDNRKRKSVFEMIRQMVRHVSINKEESVIFGMVLSSTNTISSESWFSIYKSGELIYDNVFQLPKKPTNLRIESPNTIMNESACTVLHWDHSSEGGVLCKFNVEFKSNTNEDWSKLTTTNEEIKHAIIKMDGNTIHNENSSINWTNYWEWRVAAVTCIGRSEFSPPASTATINNSFSVHCDGAMSERTTDDESLMTDHKGIVCPPPKDLRQKLVTQNAAEVSWLGPEEIPQNVEIIHFQVDYWLDADNKSSAKKEEIVEANATSCLLEDLDPESSYLVQVLAICKDKHMNSLPSDILQLTTRSKEVRFAECFQSQCEKISGGKGGEIDIYAVPLTKWELNDTTSEKYPIDRYIFHIGASIRDSSIVSQRQKKTIWFMGATGSGKTTLINAMVNYIFNVQWEDPFRFQLIKENEGISQAHSQTSRVTVYELHHVDGFRIPFSLTIVDTPGYGDTKGLHRDKEITEMIHHLFQNAAGIQEVDVVGFVAQASLPRLTPTQMYIFDSVLEIFGKDIKDNINFLCTFADSQTPPVLAAIRAAALPCQLNESTGEPLHHHKFNNSAFFCHNQQTGSTADRFNPFFWKMGIENFEKFFDILIHVETKSLALSKEVLSTRKRLEAMVDGLQPLIRIGLAKMEEMRKLTQAIANSEAEIDANKPVSIEVVVTVPKKVPITHGGYLTNCNRCYVTCHNPCALANDHDKISCYAMDSSMPRETRSCRVCPGKCIWNIHTNQDYSWTFVQEKKVSTSDEIKTKYEMASKKKLTAQELIKVLQAETEKNEEEVLEKVQTVTNCLNLLQEIALRPDPFSSPQYIDLIINAEQQEKKSGFQERIVSLQILRQKAVITSQIRNKEPIFMGQQKYRKPQKKDKRETGGSLTRALVAKFEV